jgi:hypothetical protein
VTLPFDEQPIVGVMVELLVQNAVNKIIIIIMIIIIIIITAIGLSSGGSIQYTSTDKTIKITQNNKSKYTNRTHKI